MSHDKRRATWLASVTFAIAALCPAVGATADAPAPPSAAGPAVGAEPERTPEPAPMAPDARGHYDEGLRLYGDRKFAAAIREFEAGFAIDPRREFLFAEAQAYRLSGDCASALPLYERFLGSGPSALHVDATRLALDRCARQARIVTSAAQVPPASPAPLPPPVPLAGASTERSSWWRDPWAATTLGAGVVAAGLGVGFVIASDRARDEANAPGTTRYADYDRLWSTAEWRRAIGVVSLSASAALVIAGVIRLGVVHHREASAHARPGSAFGLVSIAPLPEGASLRWQVTF